MKLQNIKEVYKDVTSLKQKIDKLGDSETIENAANTAFHTKIDDKKNGD